MSRLLGQFATFLKMLSLAILIVMSLIPSCHNSSEHTVLEASWEVIPGNVTCTNAHIRIVKVIRIAHGIPVLGRSMNIYPVQSYRDGKTVIKLFDSSSLPQYLHFSIYISDEEEPRHSGMLNTNDGCTIMRGKRHCKFKIEKAEE